MKGLNMNNDSYNNDDGNLLLSFELLHLLQWLIDHEEDELKRLVAKAVKHGYRDTSVTCSDFVEMQVSDPAIQHSIVEFLGLMDTLLFESHNEQDVDEVLSRSAIPALNQIDSSVCNQDVVETSLDKAHAQLQKDPKENVQELLLKELLKRWKPAKKNMN